MLQFDDFFKKKKWSPQVAERKQFALPADSFATFFQQRCIKTLRESGVISMFDAHSEIGRE